MKTIHTLSCTLTLCLLTACGGGGGGSSAVSPTTSSSTKTSTTIAGAVIDGYVQGATVCLDLNNNSSCEPDEPTAISKADGTFSLSYTGATAGLHLVSVIPSTAKDADDVGLTLAQAGKAAYTLMAPAPAGSANNVTVTPLSTLVSNQMKQTGATDATSVESQLKSQLGITVNLLNNDYKASATTSNVSAASLAATIASAISAAQSVLATSTVFQSALGTTNSEIIKAASQQAAMNLVTKNVVPAIVDKSTGTLTASANSSTVISSTQDVAAIPSVVQSAAVQAAAPKAFSGTAQAFMDGVIIGSPSSNGSYVDASGKTIYYSSTALEVSYIKGTGDLVNGTGSGIQKQFILSNNAWFKSLNDSPNSYLLDKGWVVEDPNAPGSIDGDCVSIKQTSQGPNQKICLTKFDYSGKKISSLIIDACIDFNGKAISGCDPNKLFPANTFAYTLRMSYDVDTYKTGHSATWKGYGDSLTPKQSTLDGFLTVMLKNNIAQATGNGCNVGFKITAYDPAKKTGTIAFADMSKFRNCDTVFSNNNINNGNYSETKAFEIKTVGNQNLMLFQTPLIFIKNNPGDDPQATKRFIGESNGLIYDGTYWAKGTEMVIDINGQQKLGNKNLLDTYLQATGAPAYPYDK